MPRRKKQLTHLTNRGEARMVDVSAKPATERLAVAEGRVIMAPKTLALVLKGNAKKGDVLGTARIAAIQAAKRTHELIPLYHPLPITQVEVDLAPDADLPGIVLAVCGATWASLRLVPSRPRRISARAIIGMAVRFPAQSVVAGVDVAARALHPRLPLRPGFVSYPTALPAGTGRDGFCALASLMPGTLPVEASSDGTVLVHCLDTRQPVLSQLAAEERRFARAFGVGRGGG